MEEIVVGNPVINRTASLNMLNYTYLATSNGATGDGVIDTVELWAYEALTNVTVGLCYGSSLTWTNRSFAFIGTVTAGSKQTFTGLELDCEAGDVIGLAASGRIESTYTSINGGLVSGGGGNKLDGEQHVYASTYTSYAISLGGSGETVEAGNKAAMHYFKNLMAGGNGR